ncbi:MAG TPA: hypothetical protein VH763_08660 [Gemmatimonadales bacterium]
MQSSSLGRSTYLSARAVARTAPAQALQLALAAGPAVMVYGGPGANLRTGSVDLGGVLELSMRVRVVHRLALEMAVSNYLYGSSYIGDPLQTGSQTTRSVFRHDLLLLPGLVYSWP